jgi:AraC-like DNA-binding protein/mannose-6-phosphate isomerase-like protein (cupin superfamily)
MNPRYRFAYKHLFPGVDFAAAFISGRARPFTPAHTHDYYEAFYLLEGKANHVLNGRGSVLQAGDLVFLRPEDCHSITGRTFRMINVAFPAESWEQFCALAGLQDSAFMTGSCEPPPCMRVPNDQRAECAAIFGRILDAFQQPARCRPPKQEICRFWSDMLQVLVPEAREEPEQSPMRPIWLSDACRAMHEEENLRSGLARFVEISGVSRAHLSRTLKAYSGQTPTEFINELRIRRSAMLLATTPEEIIDVAMDCGFDNLSYFYRCFRRYFKKSPRAWRMEAQCVTPTLRE